MILFVPRINNTKIAPPESVFTTNLIEWSTYVDNVLG